ncbi:uncharacterized protein ACR2FA_007806 [Aphomia sociella]
MVRVSTYVFLDIETTGLPREELNKTKITEISMVAVNRDHVLDNEGVPIPRVQNKLTLCINPRRMVDPESTEMTKLCNDLLERQPPFNMEVYCIINNFLNVLSKPVCLIAFNGNNFDFPIIKTHVERLNESLPNDLLCADCLCAFYDIENESTSATIGQTVERVIDNTATNVRTRKPENDNSSIVNESQVSISSNPVNIEMLTGAVNSKNYGSFIDTNEVDVIKEFMTSIDDTDFIKDMKQVNESTPKQQKFRTTEPRRIMKARRRFPWNDKRPNISYKLKDIYMRTFNSPLEDLHYAEADCIAALKVAMVKCQKFVPWVDKNCSLFSEVKPMTPGIRIGD